MRKDPVLLIVVAITVFCGLLATAIALCGYSSSNAAVVRLFDTMLTLFMTGTTAVFALLGQKISKSKRQKL
jgi:hypothetical protein